MKLKLLTGRYDIDGEYTTEFEINGENEQGGTSKHAGRGIYRSMTRRGVGNRNAIGTVGEDRQRCPRTIAQGRVQSPLNHRFRQRTVIRSRHLPPSVHPRQMSLGKPFPGEPGRAQPATNAEGSARAETRPADASASSTDSDLAAWALDTMTLYQTCRARIDALRQWDDALNSPMSRP